MKKTFILFVLLMPVILAANETFAVTSFRCNKPLRIGEIRIDPDQPKVGELIIFHIDLQGTWDNPFQENEIALDAEIKGPGGKTWNIAGFYTRDFTRTQIGDPNNPVGEVDHRVNTGPSYGEELLTSAENPEWQVRFLTNIKGSYQMTLQAVDKNGKVKQIKKFKVTTGTPRPFIRVSKTDPHYFEFEDGTPYFANGLNMCTTRGKGGTFDYDHWMTALADAGGNFMRMFKVSWRRDISYVQSEEQVKFYELDNFWRLDYVVNLALKKGIYIKHQLYGGVTRRYSLEKYHPFAKIHGGPCEKPIDVFTNEQAKAMTRNYYRYIIARYGWSPSIMAWEFVNEIDCVQGYKKEIVHACMQEMYKYLRRIDNERHMITVSLGSFSFEADLWAMPEIHFSQMHGYWKPDHPLEKLGRDMAKMMADHIEMLYPFNKPALFAETGMVSKIWGTSDRLKDDPDGVHLHNSLWSAMMAGSAGTSHEWFWVWVHMQDLWYHYRAITNFIEGVPFNTEGFRPFKPYIQPGRQRANLRAWALRGKNMTLLWVQNPNHTWWNIAEKVPLKEAGKNARGVRVVLPVFAGFKPDKTYTVEYWNTYTGEKIGTEKLRARPEGLVIEFGSFSKDIAIKVFYNN